MISGHRGGTAPALWSWAIPYLILSICADGNNRKKTGIPAVPTIYSFFLKGYIVFNRSSLLGLQVRKPTRWLSIWFWIEIKSGADIVENQSLSTSPSSAHTAYLWCAYSGLNDRVNRGMRRKWSSSEVLSQQERHSGQDTCQSTGSAHGTDLSWPI